MNTEDIGAGYRKVLKLAGLRVQPRDFIHGSVIGNPHVSIFVGNCTPGTLPAHFVFEVNNPHGIATERLHYLLVSRHIRGRFRERRIFSKNAVQIRRYVASFLVVDPYSHCGSHVLDSISPAGLVSNSGGDAGLNSVASSAGGGGLSWLRREQSSLAFSRRQELVRLIEGNVGPMHSPLLERKFERG